MSSPALPTPEQVALFTKLFEVPDFYTKAKNRGLKGQVMPMHRSLHWKLYLHYLSSTTRDTWKAEAQTHRAKYSELLDKYIVNPDVNTGDVNVNNPLSLHQDSKWSKYFEDNELSAQIKKDILRTHSEKLWFCEKENQTKMTQILFIYSKLHPDPSYRQGMNELLAPVILTVARDALQNTNGSLLETLLDSKYVEHDAYFLFDKVMLVMLQYFETKKPPSKKQASMQPSLRSTQEDESPLAVKSAQIFAKLGEVDKPLQVHLTRLEIPYQIIFLRWIRLMFSREFHLDDVMFIWDAILSAVKVPIDQTGFTLVDHISLSMLSYVRGQLLAGDSSYCLRRLMKYPPVEDIRVIVFKALFLYNSKTGNFAVSGSDIDPIALNTSMKTVPVQTRQRSREQSTQPTTTAGGGGGNSTAATGGGQGKKTKFLKAANSIKKKVKNFVRKPNGQVGQTVPKKLPYTPERKAIPVSKGSRSRATRQVRVLSDHVERPAAFTAATIDSLQKQNEQLTLAMGRLSKQLDNVITNLHVEVLRSNEEQEPFNINVVRLSIAEAKHVRDVLNGDVSLSVAFPSAEMSPLPQQPPTPVSNSLSPVKMELNADYTIPEEEVEVEPEPEPEPEPVVVEAVEVEAVEVVEEEAAVTVVVTPEGILADLAAAEEEEEEEEEGKEIIDAIVVPADEEEPVSVGVAEVVESSTAITASKAALFGGEENEDSKEENTIATAQTTSARFRAESLTGKSKFNAVALPDFLLESADEDLGLF